MLKVLMKMMVLSNAAKLIWLGQVSPFDSFHSILSEILTTSNNAHGVGEAWHGAHCNKKKDKVEKGFSCSSLMARCE